MTPDLMFLNDDSMIPSSRHLKFLINTFLQLNQDEDFEAIVETVSHGIISHFPLDAGMLWIINRETLNLEIRSFYGLPAQHKKEFMQSSVQGALLETIRNTLEPVSIEQSEGGPFFTPGIINTGIQLIRIYPLISNGEAFGLFFFTSSNPESLTREQEQVLQLIISQIGVTLWKTLEQERLRIQVARYRESDKKYRTLVESAEDCITIVQDGKIVFMNSQGIRGLEYDQAEILGKNFIDFLAPEEREKAIEYHQRRLRGEEIPTYELTVLSRSGKRITVDLKASLIEYNGRPAYQFIARDITALKKLQAHMHQSEKLAALGQLISGIAHELNNPLTSMIGFSELLLNNLELPPKFQRYLKNLNTQTIRAKSTVNKLLSFSRSHHHEKVLVNPGVILDEIIKLREYELKVNNIQLKIDHVIDVPDVLADPHQLQEVFLNLLVNAEQAILSNRDRGNIHISVYRHNTQNMVCIDFTDDGPGIPETIKDRIFEPFFTTKPDGKGTGLGLSISYNIIEDHSGMLSLVDSSSAGTCFSIMLPAASSKRKKSLDQRSEKPEKSNYQPIDSKSILLIDDEVNILEILSEILQNNGHRVVAVDNAQTALDKIREDSFDLILCDMKMPGMNGRQFYSAVRNIDPSLSKRIVFASGDIADACTRDFFTQTQNLFIAKPFRTDELFALIHEFFSTPPEEEDEDICTG